MMKKVGYFGIMLLFMMGIVGASVPNNQILYIKSESVGVGGNPFDQSLNTTDDVTFNSLTTNNNITVRNVTADYYFGDGSQLTGINSGTSLWWNDSTVATYNGTTADLGGKHTNEVCASGLCPIVELSDGNSIFGYLESFRFLIPDVVDFQGNANIESKGDGNLVVGYVKSTGMDDHRLINASGNGGLVGGATEQGNKDIIDEGTGSLVWGAGDLQNDHIGGMLVGAQAINNGSKIGCVNLGVGGICSESYGVNLGYQNNLKLGATFGSVNIGAQNIQKGRESANIGKSNTNNHDYNYMFGRGLTSQQTNGVTIGYLSNDIFINSTHININSAKITSTGSNAGTQICIDANNNLCPCGSCA